MNRTKFWIDEELDKVELLSAVYTNHSFQRHFHDFYSIIIQEKGNDKFYCRGKSYASTPGIIKTINPEEVHWGHSVDKELWTYRAFYVNASLMQKFASEDGKVSGKLPHFLSPVSFDPLLAKSLSSLHRVLESSPDTLERQIAFNTTMTLLIDRLAENGLVFRQAGGAEPYAVRIAREYIEANYASNITLDELSELTGLNSFYLVRSFRSKVGLPPHEFLTLIRVERARKLLSHGMSIVDAALEAGFVDQSHFTNRFKRITGVTPGQFVKGQFHTRNLPPR